MSLWNMFRGWFSRDETPSIPTEETLINPATGLTMIGGYGGVDAAGNPYGSSGDEIAHTTDTSDWATDDSWSNDDWSSSTNDSWSND